MPADARIFPQARTVLDALLHAMESGAPGLITACHITGSIALGDGRSGQSDVDLVLVRDGAASDADVMAALEPVLAGLRGTHPRPTLDGLVLTEADLEAGPDGIAGERAIVSDNHVRLGTDGSGRNPVTWRTLRQCGITYRGTPIGPAHLWHNPARLDAWTRENLERYWRPWLERAEGLDTHPDLAALIDEATEWGVLGVTRLHYTLATGAIASKHGAGLYALETFAPEWRPIVEEALRIRERRADRSRHPTPLALARAMREYVAMVIDAALALPVCDAATNGSQR